MDYFIVYEEGDIDNAHVATRVRVKSHENEFVDKVQVDVDREEYFEMESKKVKVGKTFKEVKKKVNKVRLNPVFADVESGFGEDRPQAVRDFIRRNSSKVINAIFDLKGVE